MVWFSILLVAPMPKFRQRRRVDVGVEPHPVQTHPARPRDRRQHIDAPPLPLRRSRQYRTVIPTPGQAGLTPAGPNVATPTAE